MAKAKIERYSGEPAIVIDGKAFPPTPALRSEIIASVADYAGCHIYSTDEDILYANENFIAVEMYPGEIKMWSLAGEM